MAAKGPNIMVGYWNDLEATRRVIRDGYYFTGDLGYQDTDGCIFLTGRSSDVIKPGGNRVSAKEIEETLLELPQVDEVAVVGVPDEVLGEAIKAFVVMSSSSCTGEALRAELSSRLPSYKVPTKFEFVDSLPKSSAGKILKTQLVEPASAS